MKATRTYRNGNASIVVELDDGTTLKPVGGNRAARAEVIIVGQWKADAPIEVVGCRADAHAGRVEARGHETATERRTHGSVYPVNPWLFCTALDIEDVTA